MKDTQNPTGTTTGQPQQQGITMVTNGAVESHNALALAILGTEIITNERAVGEKANEVMALLEEKGIGATVTLMAALFSISMEHAPDFATQQTLDIAGQYKA